VKKTLLGLLAGIALFIGCGSENKLAKINELQAAGNLRDAAKVYKEWVDSSKNPNIERDYIKFLFDNKLFLDFSKEVRSYLERFPQDTDVKELQFEYYARLARDAERTNNYEAALDYIAANLLDQNYSEYRKWESRQTTILRKWYQEAADKGDISEQKSIVTKMISRGFDNLASSIAPEIYQEMQQQVQDAQSGAQ